MFWKFYAESEKSALKKFNKLELENSPGVTYKS